VAARRGKHVGFQYEVLDPHNPAGPPAIVTIPCDLVRRWYKYSYVDYQNLAGPGVEVLDKPLAIFGGVRAYEQGGYCYLGKPAQWYIRRDCLVSFPANRIFGVYVNPNFWLYDVQAEKLERDDPFRPVNWRNRYEVLLWIRSASRPTSPGL